MLSEWTSSLESTKITEAYLRKGKKNICLFRLIRHKTRLCFRNCCPLLWVLQMIQNIYFLVLWGNLHLTKIRDWCLGLWLRPCAHPNRAGFPNTESFQQTCMCIGKCWNTVGYTICQACVTLKSCHRKSPKTENKKPCQINQLTTLAVNVKWGRKKLFVYWICVEILLEKTSYYAQVFVQQECNRAFQHCCC